MCVAACVAVCVAACVAVSVAVCVSGAQKSRIMSVPVYSDSPKQIEPGQIENLQCVLPSKSRIRLVCCLQIQSLLGTFVIERPQKFYPHV